MNDAVLRDPFEVLKCRNHSNDQGRDYAFRTEWMR